MRSVLARTASRLVAARVRPVVPVPTSTVLVRFNQQAAAQSHLFDDHDALRRRLLYRSKQRGWLEMDIMLGNWASENLAHLDGEKLAQFQEIIDLENPDLFQWLTGQKPVPGEIENPLLRQLCEDLRKAREPKVTVQSAAVFEGKVWE
mmetsp:Transcript_14807/g.29786  ORF Transcript_14807/g.29786 Transcript_14807/m.29786 type:complete len:148 (-) Transcript_14807:194-637(-)